VSRLRALLPALANKTYFNYGGQGPLPLPSLEAMRASWLRIQELGPFTTEVWPYLESLTGQLRGRLARWAGVDPHRVALTENVTSGCVLPLWGLPWREGDELLVADAEHPGVVAACTELARRQKLTLRRWSVAPLRGPAAASDAGVLTSLEQALGPRTRLVALSHLLWNTGQVMPIEAVARRLADHPQHPWLLVDAAQSFGSLPVASAAAAADVYACTGHKWCCGPEGLGAVFLSERLLAEGRPTLIGWRSLAHENAAGSAFHRDARRFEVATSCTPLAAGLDQSMDLLEQAGNAEERLAAIRRRGEQLWRGLQGIRGCTTLLTTPPPAGLVSFELEPGVGASRHPAGLVGELGQRGIWLRTLEEPACVRACTHITTTAEEVEHLLETLHLLLGSG
jgi:L-cysteine/cystine lyase